MYVTDGVRKCVVFVGILKDDKFIPKGTGFIVGVKEGPYGFHYIVTASHVISGLLTAGHVVHIRINLMEGGAILYTSTPEDWKHHSGGQLETDVAAHPVTLNINIHDVHMTPLYEAIATKDVMEQWSLGLGDEVIVCGLFKSHYGLERNVPIVRIGNLCCMPKDPIYTRYCGFMDAYLIEARSIAGLSGSPVWINQPPFRIDPKGNIMQTTGPQRFLLGLVQGHFDVKSVLEDMVMDDSNEVVPNGINTGIAVVVPVEKIVELIDTWKEDRVRGAAIWEKIANESAATSDMISDEQSSVIVSGEAAHKERFDQLLEAAVREKKADSKT